MFITSQQNNNFTVTLRYKPKYIDCFDKDSYKPDKNSVFTFLFNICTINHY